MKSTLVVASPEARSRLGLLGYWYTHLAKIAGIVLIATSIKQVIAQDGGPIHRAVWFLAGGIAAYLLGDAMFRWIMGIRSVIVRTLGAFAAFFSPIGFSWCSHSPIVTHFICLCRDQ
jgi:low temperature requirement protein LtrA